ncbi:hypothetical protein RSAG8_00623, partial [Rhizoctonia solani AG-8 WAC10335]
MMIDTGSCCQRRPWAQPLIGFWTLTHESTSQVVLRSND